MLYTWSDSSRPTAVQTHSDAAGVVAASAVHPKTFGAPSL